MVSLIRQQSQAGLLEQVDNKCNWIQVYRPVSSLDKASAYYASVSFIQ